ncbi:hypothetical protein G4B88_019420, partial [Cannabis sativa]
VESTFCCSATNDYLCAPLTFTRSFSIPLLTSLYCLCQQSAASPTQLLLPRQLAHPATASLYFCRRLQRITSKNFSNWGYSFKLQQATETGGEVGSMVNQYGIKFSVHLITSHFGNLVAKVCENLLRRGPLTLQSLIRSTELTPLQVKNSLLILIQHNCVQAFSIEQIGAGGNEVKVTQYLAVFSNILHRLRFPKFLAIVSQELDKDCEEIFEGLIQHGRLTLDQICDRAGSDKSGGGDSTVRAAVRENFNKLLNARFIERCPAPEPFLEPPTETKSSNKRGAKSAKLDGAPETEEQRIIAAAAPIEVLRFSNLATSGTDFDADEDVFGSSVGEKRKHGSLELNEEHGSKDKEVILWRVNFEEFIRCLRHKGHSWPLSRELERDGQAFDRDYFNWMELKACIENVRARLDDGAAIVLKAMLDATRSIEKKVRTENSVPLSMNTIFEEVMKSEIGRSFTLDRVRASLVQLGCSPSDETYSIDLKKIIELAQNEEVFPKLQVESIVLKRYGRDAYRMFRLLSKSGHLLETDKIADMTFVEKKETPKILNKLWQDEYLHMEKLVVTATRQVSFLLWKVNKPILWDHVLDEMYHAALNLNLRLIYEQEQKENWAGIPQLEYYRCHEWVLFVFWFEMAQYLVQVPKKKICSVFVISKLQRAAMKGKET